MVLGKKSLLSVFRKQTEYDGYRQEDTSVEDELKRSAAKAQALSTLLTSTPPAWSSEDEDDALASSKLASDEPLHSCLLGSECCAERTGTLYGRAT